jgi:lipopolysaccharide/colanic/teichoic acid biosynthesis glycosyltransferase
MVPPDSQKSTISLDYPILGVAEEVNDPPRTQRWDFIYAIDATAALLLAFLTLPIMALSALWVVLVDGGNPFFVQTRIGLDGRPYRIYKIRSMRHHHGNAQFCADGDERIIPGGHFLRLSRIDELPQLFNVLKGDMALVGPRPEQPAFVKTFLEEIPRYGERFVVKPGITGLAQVHQGYVDSLRGTRLKLKFDIFYIRNRSVALWFFIVFNTVRVVLFRHGAR